MKFFFIVLTSILLSMSANAHNGKPAKGDPPATNNEAAAEVGSSISDMFYSDYENSTLFIDFFNIKDRLNEVNILKSDKSMYEDNVQDLPADAIYEINLDVLRVGTYTLELVTSNGIKIHKEFVID